MNNAILQTRCKLFFTICIILLSLYILSPFISSIIWGTILAITFYPIYQYFTQKHSMNKIFSSCVTIFLILTIVIGPLSFLLTNASQEIPGMVDIYHNISKNGVSIPEKIKQFPSVYHYIETWLNTHKDILGEANNHMGSIGNVAFEYLMKITHKAGEATEAIGISLMTTFFILLYDTSLIKQLKTVGSHLLGQDGEDLSLKTITAIRGAVSGLVLVGLGEGVLCIPVLLICHLDHAAILAVSIGIAAIIPFCAPVVLTLICLYAFIVFGLTKALIIGVSCMIILFIGDHFIRPKLIGSSNKLPFIVVMLSILGGLHAFGILGLFVGPAVFTVAMTLWNTIAKKDEFI
jgi:predicted PurR-regulated permease PerM